MSSIFVIAEHRRGEIRDVTWELLTKGRELANVSNSDLVAVLLGSGVANFATSLAQRTDQVLYVEDERLENFNGEAYQKALVQLFEEYQPFITLVGHTAYGMEFAPSLAARLGIPIATDCIDLQLHDGKLKAIRQMYGGKVNAEIDIFCPAPYLMTVRQGSFSGEANGIDTGQIKTLSLQVEDADLKKFIEYVEAVVGDVDITKADTLVSVGQGIGDEKNIPVVSELADALGATLSCSRPVVDRKWLPKERQVGTSGKTVKPKIYLAVGISGAFQHLAGIKGGTIIAINKDPKAPIFHTADYGIVGDLFKIVPLLTSKVKEIKGG